MIRGVKLVTIPTRDQERALTFWTEQLGLAVATDQPMGPGQRWIELRIPRADTRVVLFTPPGHEDRIGTWASLTFWTDDLDATYDAFVAAGVETLGPPEQAPWGSSFKFRDPDGNTFLLSAS